MTGVEILVFVGGSLIAYWGVSRLLDLRTTKASEEFEHRTASHDTEGAAGRNRADATGGPTEHGLEDDIPIRDTWFRILGVPENATSDAIACAYKRKIREYHPDKVASMGEELRDLAESMSKRINAAYDYASRLRQ